jgi:ubiquinone/menaquinone biosynthesis C-methylase UbiE
MSVETAIPPCVDFRGSAAGAAFDRIAEDYDQRFTDTLIGRAQRDEVWRVLARTWKKDDRVLELNCGTGEDAVFLANNGISVLACDASRQMIAKARERLQHHPHHLPVFFRELATERVGELDPEMKFDGAFSNFSGLNCIADLAVVASSLASLTGQNGKLILCFSTRFCLIEILYFLARGKLSKALRRCKGHTEVMLDGVRFTVYYPTIGQIRRAFAPAFRLYSCIGIGVTVPPSYLEEWARQRPGLFRIIRRAERLLARLPIVRSTGDHVLLCFEKVSR